MPQLPQNITFQWHITDHCNLRCKHCYQNSYTDNGLPLADELLILKELQNFVKAMQKEHASVKTHINFTGGEPFIRNNFLQLLQHTRDTGMFSFGILSNGSLLADTELLQLQQLQPSFVQLSLEGGQEMNDSIRGKGTSQMVAKALQTYRKLNINTMLSFTANAQNYKEFPEVVKFAHKYKAGKLWTDRYLPASLDDPLRLTVDQTQEFFGILANEQKRHSYRFLSKTKISAHRALQFLNSGGKAYSCTAGSTLLTIMPQGEIYPCRRLPIPVGNILQNNLVDVYLNNSTLKDLRESHTENESCASCYYKSSCKGGLKCLAFAESGDYRAKDPGCWL